MTDYNQLIPLNPDPIALRESDILMFLIVRNEALKLPFLLDYYRNIGVDRFFIVDDHSSDGSTDFILKQPDCHIFRPKNSFKESREGLMWVEELLNAHGSNHWVMKIDADELLVYPYVERLSLKQLCSFLDKEGSTAFSVFMLDMYPEGGLSTARCVPGKPFYEICPLFARDYTFNAARLFNRKKPRYPTQGVMGGPRLRVFYPEQARQAWLGKLGIRLAFKAAAFARKAGLKFQRFPHPHPCLSKIGIYKWQRGYNLSSSHTVSGPLVYSRCSGVLLHFKFFSDFHEKALEEANREQHYGGGCEYKRYLSKIKEKPNLSFIYAGSRKYEGSKSIMDCGLMTGTPELRDYASTIPSFSA